MSTMQALRVASVAVVLVSTWLMPGVVGATPQRLVLPAVSYLALSFGLEGLRRWLRQRGLPIVGALVLIDGIYLTWAMWATGGPDSPLRFLVYVHLVAVTLLASYRTGLKVALWHSLLYFALIYAWVAGILPSGMEATGRPAVRFHQPALFNVTAFWVVALGTAIFSSINERELRRRRADLEVLTAMAAELENATDARSIARILLDAVGSAIGFNRGAVLGAPEGELSVLAYAGPGDAPDPAPGMDQLVKRVWEKRGTVLVRKIDAPENRQLAQLMPAARNVVVVPLIADAYPLGALVIEHTERIRARLDRRVVSIVGQFASHAALALRNAWLLDAILEMAETDPLTGIANRRTFELTLERELARARRSGEQVTLVMIDVDNFKSFNDTYGHQAGDEALREIARALSARCRGSDLLARYGGEELAVILPSCQWSESLVAAERLRAAMVGMNSVGELTVSAGVATFPTHALDAAALIHAADEALYQSKSAGRNRVTRSHRVIALPAGHSAAAASLRPTRALEDTRPGPGVHVSGAAESLLLRAPTGDRRESSRSPAESGQMSTLRSGHFDARARRTSGPPTDVESADPAEVSVPVSEPGAVPLVRLTRALQVASIVAAAVLVPVVVTTPASMAWRAAAVGVLISLSISWAWGLGHDRARVPVTAAEACLLFGVGWVVGPEPAMLALASTTLALRSSRLQVGGMLAASLVYAALWTALRVAEADAPAVPVGIEGVGVAFVAAAYIGAHLLRRSGVAQRLDRASRRADTSFAASQDRLGTLAGLRDAATGFLERPKDTFVQVGAVADGAMKIVAGMEFSGIEVPLNDLAAGVRSQLAGGRVVEAHGRRAGELVNALGGGRGMSHIVLIPVVVGQDLAGVLAVSAKSQFPRDVRRGLEVLASKAEIALANGAIGEAIQRSERRFRSLVQSSSDVIFIVHADSTIQYATPSAQRVFGYEPEELTGTRLTEMVHPDESSALLAFFSQAADQLGDASVSEWRVRHRDGTWISTETAITNLLHEPDIGGFVLTTRDITERKMLEQQLSHQAFHDPVTNLANRALFVDRLQHALTRIRHDGRVLAVLLLDLDDFKTVNDSLGHIVGDQLLVEVGKRLQDRLRPGDTLARVGGDEFGILLEDVQGRSDATAAAEAIGSALQSPIPLGDTEVFIHASIGVTLSDGAEDADDLLRDADVAMHTAKTYRRGGWEVFEPAMHEAMVERLNLRADLERAVEGAELLLHFQPIIDLHSGGVVAVEALVRWMHPKRGLLSPADFVPLAEETGLILQLDGWVLRAASRAASRLQAASRHPVKMSVNLSARQLQRPDLVDEIARVLGEAGLDPTLLTLEITESVLLQDSETTIKQLGQLKDLGVHLAIDDFGTGYSSLSYLRRFPIDMLKIDKLFVEGVESRPEEKALLHAIVTMAHALSLQTVAEGIESQEQWDQLEQLGCRYGQGYLFARPMDLSSIEAFLQRPIIDPSKRAMSGEWRAHSTPQSVA